MGTFNSRLQEFINFKNLNASGFSLELGYDNPEKIYRLLRNAKNKPSLDIIQAISNKFVELNIDWLLNNRGVMLVNPEENPVPISVPGPYNKTPHSSVVHEPDGNKHYSPANSPAFYNSFKALKEMAGRVTDDARPCFIANIPAYVGCEVEQCHAITLETRVPKESWLFVKQVANWQEFLEVGLLYMVALTDGRKLFYKIEASAQPSKLHLTPLNPSCPAIHLDYSLIESIWIIKGYLPPPLIN